MTSAVAAYYDGFRERLLGDYLHGNPRVSAALDFAKDALTGVESILDVGCGIGWTSAELAATGATVTGIDISPALVETARETFGDVCEFIAADFVEADLGPYAAVLMVDSYEHFARRDRPLAHEQIRRTQAERVVLTVPTIASMNYAREHGIALQIIDEDVSEADLWDLAADIGGEVAVNRTVSVYRSDDYRHVLVRR